MENLQYIIFNIVLMALIIISIQHLFTTLAVRRQIQIKEWFLYISTCILIFLALKLNAFQDVLDLLP